MYLRQSANNAIPTAITAMLDAPPILKETLAKLARKCDIRNESFEAAVSRLIKSGVSKDLVERFLKEQGLV
jgi:hypothetical protein